MNKKLYELSARSRFKEVHIKAASILFLLTLVLQPVLASEWIGSGISSKDLKEIYFDKSSFKNLGKGEYEIWTKWLYRMKDPKSLTELNYSIVKIGFNCTQLKQRCKDLVNYNKKNTPLEIRKDISEYSIPWSEVVPDSVEEGVLEFFCVKSCFIEENNIKSYETLYYDGLLSGRGEIELANKKLEECRANDKK